MSKHFGARERALTILAVPVALGLSIGCSSAAFADTGSGAPGDGTVGNAGNPKPAPQGQPDSNNGYTCDNNTGIGNGESRVRRVR